MVPIRLVVMWIVEEQMGAIDVHQPHAVGSRQLRRRQNLAGWTGGDDAPCQEDHIVGVPGLRQIVRGDDDRAPVSVLGADGVPDRLDGHHIKAGGRLVQQQDVVVLRQPLGQQHPVAFPARQSGEVAHGKVVDVGPLHRLVNHPAILPVEKAQRPPARVAAHTDHLPDRDR